MRPAAALAAILVWSGPAQAQPTTFNTDAVSNEALRKAETEIKAMPEPELRALMGYFATCSDRHTNIESTRHACRTAGVLYRTEFANDRAIDQAIGELEKLVEAQRTFRGLGISPKTDFVDGVDTRLRNAVGMALRSKRAKQ